MSSSELDALYQSAMTPVPVTPDATPVAKATPEPEKELTPEELKACAYAWMQAYEDDKQHLQELQEGPDGEAYARIVQAQKDITLCEEKLKDAVKAARVDVKGTSTLAHLSVKHQADKVTWHLDAIAPEPWAGAVIVQDVDAKTFDALVKSGRIKAPDRYRDVEQGKEILAVTIQKKLG